MSQKELLYLEDAIGHEDSIINICNDRISSVDDEEIVSFLNCEVQKHTETKEKLMNLLEVKSNE